MFGHDKTDDTSQQTNTPDPNDDQTLVDQTVEQMPQDELSLPEPEIHSPVQEVAMPSASINITPTGTLNNLGALRQDALHELSPLIGHLDQTPDEKYATAKMVYEETKDQNLLSAVYEAAKNLPDDKAKAEAIYDVIQKINAAN